MDWDLKIIPSLQARLSKARPEGAFDLLGIISRYSCPEARDCRYVESSE